MVSYFTHKIFNANWSKNFNRHLKMFKILCHHCTIFFHFFSPLCMTCEVSSFHLIHFCLKEQSFLKNKFLLWIVWSWWLVRVLNSCWAIKAKVLSFLFNICDQLIIIYENKSAVFCMLVIQCWYWLIKFSSSAYIETFI